MADKILDLLNSTGFPFQHACADVISQVAGYEVALEVPFTDPGSNGPLIGLHGQIDILAVRPTKSNDALACLVIECKRASSNIKNWILLPDHQRRPRWPTFMFSLEADRPQQKLGTNRNVTFGELGYASGRDYDYCINGIEYNEDFRALNRASEEKIFRPLRQVTHAAHAFESTYPKIFDGLDQLRLPGYRMRITVPVIVTTANLYRAEFDPKAVVDGDIPPDGLSIGGPRQWLTYEAPLPDHHSYRVDRGPNSNYTVATRTVFVVNHKSLVEFLTRVGDVTMHDTPPPK